MGAQSVLRVLTTVTALKCLNLLVVNAYQFIEQPESVIQANGLEAEFKCLCPNATSHVWMLNGEPRSDDQFPPEVTRIPPSVDSPARLIIPATPKYNNTVVQCRAYGVEGNPLSEVATLQVYDIECSVIPTTEGNITISWNNPFTTEIMFCVEVRSVESSENTTFVHVNDREYTLSSHDSDLCEEFSFTVTPTYRGTHGISSQPVIGYFLRKAIQNVRCQQGKDAGDTTCEVIFATPLRCDCDLVFSSTKISSTGAPNNIKGNGNAIYPLSPVIVPNHHYSVDGKITLSSGNQQELLPQNITTHDIVEANAIPSSSEGALNTSCVFVQNTTAKGYLAIVSEVSCLPNSSDAVFIAEYNTAGTCDITKGIGKGSYRVAFFDLESDGLPTPVDDDSASSSARMMKVDIPGGNRDQRVLNTSKEVNTTSSFNDTHLCISCLSEVDCLVLLYNCKHPDLLVSLSVSANRKTCTSLNDTHSQFYYAAYFKVHDLGLPRHPNNVIKIKSDKKSNAVANTIIVSAVVWFCTLVSVLIT